MLAGCRAPSHGIQRLVYSTGFYFMDGIPMALGDLASLCPAQNSSSEACGGVDQTSNRPGWFQRAIGADVPGV